MEKFKSILLTIFDPVSYIVSTKFLEKAYKLFINNIFAQILLSFVYLTVWKCVCSHSGASQPAFQCCLCVCSVCPEPFLNPFFWSRTHCNSIKAECFISSLRLSILLQKSVLYFSFRLSFFSNFVCCTAVLSNTSSFVFVLFF